MTFRRSPVLAVLAADARVFASSTQIPRANVRSRGAPERGICLCAAGTLAFPKAGRQLTGKESRENIRYFSGLRRFGRCHFRNVSGRLLPPFRRDLHDHPPVLLTTCIDHERRLRERLNYDGIVILDHTYLPAGGASFRTRLTEFAIDYRSWKPGAHNAEGESDETSLRRFSFF